MDRSIEMMVSAGMYINPLRGSFSLPSLADGSEAISEAEEIHEVIDRFKILRCFFCV